MEKYAWRGKIVPGMQEEYKKRHDNIWPEMKEVLAKAGIVNYSIWMQGEELFGYYECEKGVDYAAKVQAESDVVKKWDEYMKDILIMEKDPVTGAQPLLTQFQIKEAVDILWKNIIWPWISVLPVDDIFWDTWRTAK